MTDEYSVEAIRKWRYHSKERCVKYLIKWKGFDEEENTWEPVDHLNCPDILKTFEKNMPEKQKRYYDVGYLRYGALTGFQRNAEFVRCMGADGPHESDSECTDKVKKQKFYCLIEFDDSDQLEEVHIDEFLDHEPEKAFEFIEQRIFVFTRPTQ